MTSYRKPQAKLPIWFILWTWFRRTPCDFYKYWQELYLILC